MFNPIMEQMFRTFTDPFHVPPREG